jgi:hypothetical protein
MEKPEQLSFNYEAKETQSEQPKKEEKARAERPIGIELDDECQYCGASYESDRSCQYCASNPTKRAYLKGLGK